MKVDFLLIGHGIAGISLFEHLEAKGKNCIIINTEKEFSSSKVAAGLYNPITGRKMKQTWLANILFPYLINFYRALQAKLDANFLTEKCIYRPFATIEDQNDWLSNSTANHEFVEKTFTSSAFGEFVNDEYGGLLLNSSGYVNLKKLITHHKMYLLSANKYREIQFEFRNLEIAYQSFKYEDIEAKHLVFCEGPLADNPYFSWLPTAPVKGEILHIKTEKALPENVIFNKGVFIIRDEEMDHYRVGSTYEWKNLDTTPTKKAKNQLMQKLSEVLKIPYAIVDQVAGIRPATQDRKPFLGEHPEIKNMFIFNGLGTKGVSLAPYFAKLLANYIINGEDLHNEVNINRYNLLYSS